MNNYIKRNEFLFLFLSLLVYAITSVLFFWDYGDKFQVWNSRVFFAIIPIGVLFYVLLYFFNRKNILEKDYLTFFVWLVIYFILLIIVEATTIYILIPKENLTNNFSGIFPKEFVNKNKIDVIKGMALGFTITYGSNIAFYTILYTTLVLVFHLKISNPIIQTKIKKKETDQARKMKLIVWHVVAWILFMFYQYVFSTSKIIKDPKIVITELVMISFTISFFYLNLYTSFRLLINDKIFLALVWSLFLWIVLVLLKQMVFVVLVENFHLPAFIYGENVMPEIEKLVKNMAKSPFFFKNPILKKQMYASAVSAQIWSKIPSKELFVLACSVFYGYARKLIETQRKLLASQILMLKAQINPHFLFNSLNFLYSKSLNHSEELAKSTILLSEIMRYGLNETEEGDKVALENEIKHLENFIEFNQHRFSNKICVEFEKDGNFKLRRIMPLLLITFVENAFKYGELFDEKDPIRISAKVIEDKLFFKVSNRKRIGPKELSTGLGIDNIKNRLELGYPKRFKVDVIEDEFYYNIELKLLL